MLLVANVKEPSDQNLQRMTTSSLNFNENMSQHIFAAISRPGTYIGGGGGG